MPRDLLIGKPGDSPRRKDMLQLGVLTVYDNAKDVGTVFEKKEDVEKPLAIICTDSDDGLGALIQSGQITPTQLTHMFEGQVTRHASPGQYYRMDSIVISPNVTFSELIGNLQTFEGGTTAHIGRHTNAGLYRFAHHSTREDNVQVPGTYVLAMDDLDLLKTLGKFDKDAFRPKPSQQLTSPLNMSLLHMGYKTRFSNKGYQTLHDHLS